MNTSFTKMTTKTNVPVRNRKINDKWSWNCVVRMIDSWGCSHFVCVCFFFPKSIWNIEKVNDATKFTLMIVTQSVLHYTLSFKHTAFPSYYLATSPEMLTLLWKGTSFFPCLEIKFMNSRLPNFIREMFLLKLVWYLGLFWVLMVSLCSWTSHFTLATSLPSKE